MEDLEGAIAEVDHVALEKCSGRRHVGEVIRGRIEVLAGDGIDQELRQIHARPPHDGDELGVALRREERRLLGRRDQLVGLCRMDQTLVELMQAADVVVVSVGGDGYHPLVRCQQTGALQCISKRGNPGAGVHDEVEVPARDEEHVALQQGMDRRLVEPGDPVVEWLGPPPVLCNREGMRVGREHKLIISIGRSGVPGG